jgi:di/tricarboxylate transporter
MDNNTFIGFSWYIYPIMLVVMILMLLWFRGYSLNPLSYIEDYYENKRLEEAFNMGLTWEQYKKKYNIEEKKET